MNSKKRARAAAPKPDPRRFVEIEGSQSFGIEITTGQAWMGSSNQVGHYTAAVLYALTDEQYTELLVDGWITDGPSVQDIWSFKRDERRLYDPRDGAKWPEHWLPERPRTVPPSFRGELWRHIDALGQPAHGEEVEISRMLAAGVGHFQSDDERITAIGLDLTGDHAYPRPAALIAGLGPGSSRDRARAKLGAPLEPEGDVYAIEGIRLRLGYDADSLSTITVELPGSTSTSRRARRAHRCGT